MYFFYFIFYQLPRSISILSNLDVWDYVFNFSNLTLIEPLIKNVAELHCDQMHTRLLQQSHPLTSNLSARSLPGNRPRRLNGQWPREFLTL